MESTTTVDSCQCCPYGFHIDTDFVRYCETLLKSLYSKHSTNSSNRSTSRKFSFSSLDNDYRSNHHWLDDYFTEACFYFKQNPVTPRNGLYQQRQPQHYPSNYFIPLDTESMLSEAVNKFEEVYMESQSYSSSKCADQCSPSPSPTPSSCSTISRTVLSQIRNHLANSLSRVKDLETQVSSIPSLKEEISKLKAERSRLLNKKVDNWSQFKVDSISLVSSTNLDLSEKTFANKSTTTEPSNGRLSVLRSETLIFGTKSETRSIGTLTSFAPCVFNRNALVQTELKSKDLRVKVATATIATETDAVTHQSISCQTNFDNDDDCTKLTHDNGSQTECSTLKDVQIQVCSLQPSMEKAVSTSDLFDSISFELITDSRQQQLTPKSALSMDRSTDPPSSTSSTQSIRLCDKCNEMTSSDASSCPPDIVSLPKIIKSDSGISVERKVDHKTIDDSIYPSSDLEMSISENTQLSDDSDYSSKYSNKIEKKFDYRNLQINGEAKVAMKIINEHLLEPKKSNFIFSKSVAFVKKIWFKISSSVDSDSRIVEFYLDYFEKLSLKMLNYIVNLSDTNGNTAMHYAISYNNFHIVSVLLDSKVCDVNKYNKAGYTATMLVSLAKIENDVYRDVVERLFNHADLNIKAKQNGQTALMLAASHGRLEISKILLECGAEVNLQDNDGSTALMCAAEHGHSEVVSLLLAQSDCDPLIEDNEGSTALKIALVNGHNDVGIQLYAGTRNSSTPLYSSLNQLSNLCSPHLRRTGSFSYSPSSSPYNYKLSPMNRNRTFLSTPSSPN